MKDLSIPGSLSKTPFFRSSDRIRAARTVAEALGIFNFLAASARVGLVCQMRTNSLMLFLVPIYLPTSPQFTGQPPCRDKLALILR